MNSFIDTATQLDVAFNRQQTVASVTASLKNFV